MKAVKSGRILGYALENFDSENTSEDGMIEVTVNVQDWSPEMKGYDLDEKLSSTTIPNISETETSFGKLFGVMKKYLKVWFADAQNAIDDFYAATIHTKLLCVADSSGETCVNRSQFNQVFGSVGTQNSAPVGNTNSSTNNPGTSSSTSSWVDNTSTTTTSTSSTTTPTDNTSTPDPAPAPTTDTAPTSQEPAPAPTPDPTPDPALAQ
jgi:hypothetical protein